MPQPAGYFVDRKDGGGDLFICRVCAEENDLVQTLDKSISQQSFNFLPIKCGIHIYGADPKDYQ
jgi:hypothetical protein